MSEQNVCPRGRVEDRAAGHSYYGKDSNTGPHVAGAEDSKFKKGDGNAELYEAGKFVAIYPGVRAL